MGSTRQATPIFYGPLKRSTLPVFPWKAHFYELSTGNFLGPSNVPQLSILAFSGLIPSLLFTSAFRLAAGSSLSAWRHCQQTFHPSLAGMLKHMYVSADDCGFWAKESCAQRSGPCPPAVCGSFRGLYIFALACKPYP